MIGETSKQIITGNIFLIICCVFYLVWWTIAFKPEGAIKGMKSGWLLMPAVLFGVLSIILLVGAFRIPEGTDPLFSNLLVAIAGVVIYAVSFVITYFFFHRIVTTELLLIVGWTVLAVCESNTLSANGVILKGAAWIMIIVSLIVGTISLICYMRYYSLDAQKGWICGMIPLILVMAVILMFTVMTLMNNKTGAGGEDMAAGLKEIRITSESLRDGVWNNVITNTKNGSNASPELSWDEVDGAGEYAVYMFDPSADNWMHWRAHGITTTHLNEGDDVGEYIGPYPPSGTHTYIVYVFALKTAADSYPGSFDSENKGIEDIIAGLDRAGGKSGNIIARGSLSGTYIINQ